MTEDVVSLLEDISAQLRRNSSTPWDQLLWSAEDIAAHMGLSKRTVSDRFACRPDFPTPVRLGGSYRWYAHEVCAWVEENRA